MADRVLVHGASGFVGAHLVHALAHRGAHIVATSHKPFDIGNRSVETHFGKWCEAEHFAKVLTDCRAVIHVASTSTPGSTAGDPLTELQANLSPTLALIQALQAHPNIHLVYVSSGGSLYPPIDTAASESAPIKPRSYHGAGKAAAEHFIQAWCAQHDVHATILRPSNIYGPGQMQRATFAIIPTAMNCILRDEPLTIWGDGSSIRDYLYIDDFISLCTAVLDDRNAAECNIFNASSGQATRLDELLSMIESVSGKQLHFEYTRPRRVDANHVAIDNSAATLRYAWSPSVGLHDGLKRTWAWMISGQR